MNKRLASGRVLRLRPPPHRTCVCLRASARICVRLRASACVACVLVCLYTSASACVRLRPRASVCVCVRAFASACVRLRSSACRRLKVRTRLDANGSLRLDASFVQGLSGCTIGSTPAERVGERKVDRFQHWVQVTGLLLGLAVESPLVGTGWFVCKHICAHSFSFNDQTAFLPFLKAATDAFPVNHKCKDNCVNLLHVARLHTFRILSVFD